jgi:hypothetical protein
VDEEDAGENNPGVSLPGVLGARIGDDPEELGEKNDPIDGIDTPEALPCEGGDGMGVADVIPMRGEDDDSAEDEEELDAESAGIEGKSTGQQSCMVNDHENRCEGTTSL